MPLQYFQLRMGLTPADPIVGTWKLNISKSKLPPELSNIKELSFTIREIGVDYVSKSRTSKTQV